jgi:hypothetical protein
LRSNVYHPIWSYRNDTALVEFDALREVEPELTIPSSFVMLAHPYTRMESRGSNGTLHVAAVS